MTAFKYKPAGIKQAIKYEILKIFTTTLMGILTIVVVFKFKDTNQYEVLGISLIFGLFAIVTRVYYQALATKEIIDNQPGFKKINIKQYIKSILWLYASKLVYIYLPLSVLVYVMIQLGKAKLVMVAILTILIVLLYLLIIMLPLKVNSFYRLLYTRELNLKLTGKKIRTTYVELGFKYISIYIFINIGTKITNYLQYGVPVNEKVLYLFGYTMIGFSFALLLAYLDLCLLANVSKIFYIEKGNKL